MPQGGRKGDEVFFDHRSGEAGVLSVLVPFSSAKIEWAGFFGHCAAFGPETGLFGSCRAGFDARDAESSAR
jgi:hypothetical protein